jgi:hypothetical protein
MQTETQRIEIDTPERPDDRGREPAFVRSASAYGHAIDT